MEKDRRRDPRLPGTISSADFRRGTLGRLGVLVDDASDHLAAAGLGAWRDGGWLVKGGGKLVPGLVRPVIVIVRGVLGQHGARVRLAVDPQPVRALGPGSPHEPFGKAIRARSPRRSLHDLDPR